MEYLGPVLAKPTSSNQGICEKKESPDFLSLQPKDGTMAKPRRGIKFNHRLSNGHSSSADGRRSSFSDISEVASEPGSPAKAGTGSDIALEVGRSSARYECIANFCFEDAECPDIRI